MANNIVIVVRSAGAPQGSKRHLGNGVMIESSQRVKPFRQDVKYAAAEVIPADWDRAADMAVKVDFHFRRPQSHLTTKGALTKNAPLYPVGRNIGDLDKLCRSLLDALTGVVFHDDSQVIDLVSRKRYSDSDQTIITIECLNTPNG